MDFLILAVGKGRATLENKLAHIWLTRLPGGGKIIEVTSNLPAGPKKIADEGNKLLQCVPEGSSLAVLDPNGTDHSSEDFAELIGRWQNDRYKTACFVIGGAEGHCKSIFNHADTIISFGKATWPHMLFRAMLAEQLYRANKILDGHPYHRKKCYL